jgi:hypothetical protein
LPYPGVQPGLPRSLGLGRLRPRPTSVPFWAWAGIDQAAPAPSLGRHLQAAPAPSLGRHSLGRPSSSSRGRLLRESPVHAAFPIYRPPVSGTDTCAPVAIAIWAGSVIDAVVKGGTISLWFYSGFGKVLEPSHTGFPWFFWFLSFSSFLCRFLQFWVDFLIFSVFFLKSKHLLIFLKIYKNKF